MTIDTSREAVEALADELIGDSASAYLENRGAMDELGDRLQLAADTFTALLAERDAALAEVARLSTPPDDAEVAKLVAEVRDWIFVDPWGAQVLMNAMADALTRLSHALTAIERAAYERGVRDAADQFNDGGQLVNPRAVILALLTQEGR